MTDVRQTGGERADLVEALDRHRFFLRNTLNGVTDEQAGQRSTVSELTLAGLIKHVTGRRWPGSSPPTPSSRSTLTI